MHYEPVDRLLFRWHMIIRHPWTRMHISAHAASSISGHPQRWCSTSRFHIQSICSPALVCMHRRLWICIFEGYLAHGHVWSLSVHGIAHICSLLSANFIHNLVGRWSDVHFFPCCSDTTDGLTHTFFCGECDASFHTREDLESHQKLVGHKAEKYVCEVCSSAIWVLCLW